MSILVTGGAGFIGSHVVETLLARGESVVVLDNLSTGTLENLPEHAAKLTFIEGDIRNPADITRALQSVSTNMAGVIHLAAQVSVLASLQNPYSSFEHNVMGTENVLNALRQTGFTGRVVYASSAAVYGEPAGAAPLMETDANGAKPLSRYALDKQQNEAQMAYYSAQYGFSCIGARFFNVYGTRQDPTSPYSGVISIFAHAIAAQKPLTIYGDGSQTRDFVSVTDVAATVCDLLKTKTTGVLNIGTGQATSLNTLVEALGAAPESIVHQPARTGDIQHSVANIARLQQQFPKLKPTALAVGLQRLLAR